LERCQIINFPNHVLTGATAQAEGESKFVKKKKKQVGNWDGNLIPKAVS
jgi:hypothetical protein